MRVIAVANAIIEIDAVMILQEGYRSLDFERNLFTHHFCNASITFPAVMRPRCFVRLRTNSAEL